MLSLPTFSYEFEIDLGKPFSLKGTNDKFVGGSGKNNLFSR